MKASISPSDNSGEAILLNRYSVNLPKSEHVTDKNVTGKNQEESVDDKSHYVPGLATPKNISIIPDISLPTMHEVCYYIDTRSGKIGRACTIVASVMLMCVCSNSGVMHAFGQSSINIGIIAALLMTVSCMIMIPMDTFPDGLSWRVCHILYTAVLTLLVSTGMHITGMHTSRLLIALEVFLMVALPLLLLDVAHQVSSQATCLNR